jgi:hypothetical protein
VHSGLITFVITVLITVNVELLVMWHHISLSGTAGIRIKKDTKAEEVLEPD